MSIEFKAPHGKLRVVGAAIVGHHDADRIIKDVDNKEEALAAAATAGPNEDVYFYNDQGVSQKIQ